MGILAKLHAEGNTYNVLEADFSIRQKIDGSGKPSSKPVFRGLYLVLEASKDNFFFDKAMHETDDIKEMILEYIPSTLGSKSRRLSFYDCHVVSHHHGFRPHTGQPMKETIMVTAAGVEDSSSPSPGYSAYWRRTFKSTYQVMDDPETVDDSPKKEEIKDERNGRYDVTYQSTIVSTDRYINKSVTSVKSISIRNQSNNFSYVNGVPTPVGKTTQIKSITSTYISGDGDILKSDNVEITSIKEDGAKFFNEIDSREGEVNLELGTICYSDGTTRELAVNYKSDINKIAKFNAVEDIDFPRAAGQDAVDGRNDVLGILGLAPVEGLGPLTFLISKSEYLDTAAEIAEKGFQIQHSQFGEVGVVKYEKGSVVNRFFKSDLLK